MRRRCESCRRSGRVLVRVTLPGDDEATPGPVFHVCSDCTRHPAIAATV